MARNLVRPGSYIEAALPTATVGGEPYLIGGIVGVAAGDFQPNEEGKFFYDGVWRFRKAFGATSPAGMPVYWDAAARQAVFSPSTFRIGSTARAALNGQGFVLVDGSLAVGTSSGMDESAVRALVASASDSIRPASGAYLPGSFGNYVQGGNWPLQAGGVRLEVDVALDSWTVALNLLSKEAATNKREVRMFVGADGRLGCAWSEDGSAVKWLSSTAPLPFVPGQRAQVFVELAPSVNGGTQYRFTCGYRTLNTDAWVVHSTTVAGPASSIFVSDAAWEIGSRFGGTAERASGVFYRAAVMSIGGDLIAEWRGDVRGPLYRDSNGRVWSLVQPTSSAWNGSQPFIMGTTWHWYDAFGVMWSKTGSAPTSETDGSRVNDEPNSTTAAMSSAANSINTSNKYQNRRVYNTTLMRTLHSNGGGATAPWLNPDGTVQITPA